jgi:hypothetical protein
VYCTVEDGTAGTERRRGGAREGLTKEDRNGDGGRDKWKGYDKRSDEESLRGGYNPKKEEWEKGGGEGSPHTTIRQEPRRPEMQNTGEGTQKGGGREDNEPDAKPK